MKECRKCHQICAYEGFNVDECANKSCDLYTEKQHRDYIEFCNKYRDYSPSSPSSEDTYEPDWQYASGSRYNWHSFSKTIDDMFDATFNLDFSCDDDEEDLDDDGA